jgi:aspartate racemase
MNMANEKIIGIVGGVGPFAGFDLCQKIHDQTRANIDQEHLPIALLSWPSQITDRTAFLLGRTNINPAVSIAAIIKKLEALGAGVVGIPCNASHAPRIFEVVLQELKKAHCRVKLLHMIDEVAIFIKTHFPQVKNVGVLSVTGTYKSGIYQSVLAEKGFLVTMPDEYVQTNFVHQAIYDPGYGIKAHSHPPTVMAKELLSKAIDFLRAKDVDAVVLGCTEIPLAITAKIIGGVVIIDTNQVLARALIREAAPEKLKPVADVINYEVVS